MRVGGEDELIQNSDIRYGFVLFPEPFSLYNEIRLIRRNLERYPVGGHSIMSSFGIR